MSGLQLRVGNYKNRSHTHQDDPFLLFRMSYRTMNLHHLGIITAIVLTPMLTAWQQSPPSPPISMVKVAKAPVVPFPLNGAAIYVLRNESWQEAIPIGYQWSPNKGWQYTVNYQSDDSKEQNVSIDRIITLAEAQQRKITTNVYDLSTQTGVQQMVDAHNSWRKESGVTPLAWSPKLATFAQEWADKLLATDEFKHRTDHDYGENLAAAQGQSMSPTTVVKYWGEEVQNYDYNKNSCKPGEMCGHYTQVVWKSTKEVGCAMAKSGIKEVWVCNYNPPGNYVGEKPY
jgi:pathogenesis-related protein 1